MLDEADAQDFDALLSEGPAQFVASLSTEAILEPETVALAAHDFIHSKTAVFIGDTQKDDGSPMYKRVGRVREVFVDTLEEFDDPKPLSYVGKTPTRQKTLPRDKHASRATPSSPQPTLYHKEQAGQGLFRSILLCRKP